jgi:hypothetical protein
MVASSPIKVPSMSIKISRITNQFNRITAGHGFAL